MPRAVLVGASASAVHGLWVLRSRGGEKVHVTVPGQRLPGKSRRASGVRYHLSTLQPSEIVEVSGVRVTSAARAVADLARLEGHVRAVIAGDSFLRAGGDAAELRAAVDSLAGYRGIAQARRMVELVDARSESPYESLARVLLVPHVAPLGVRVVPQVWALPGVRVDLLVGETVVVEVDGRVRADSPLSGRVGKGLLCPVLEVTDVTAGAGVSRPISPLLRGVGKRLIASREVL